MHTPIPADSVFAPQAREAGELIKSCVHCGFCLPACPTYQLLGDELDSPRGRIYLIKQTAEGRQPSAITRLHLDRCLTCRSCESACPSGVRYGELLDLGREMVELASPRPVPQRSLRAAMAAVLSNPPLFAAAIGAARLLRPLLPARYAALLPRRQARVPWPRAAHARRMIALEGCVQGSLAPAINAAAAQLLDRIGISLVRPPRSVCCGALQHHLGRPEPALAQARRNIDQWIDMLEGGAEGIVITASGCGAMIKDYGRLFRHEAAYAAKAARVGAAARDLCEIVEPQDLVRAKLTGGAGRRVAWQSPCTLQHGQQIRGRVEALLRAAGFLVSEPAEAARCCGSAGTYSLLQPQLSQQLRELKLASLEAESPEVIATANIGCLQHLSAQSRVPVRHWVELLRQA